ncbi:spermidine/putrescine ABC transporter permease [Thermogemmatispora aurantia]|uniref:Spermidine/putrescine ABC transporter permease n=1 Tax=Thermogemmatispora aurantia TaxID=2045279 RepID=A0A5J4KD62_9CHLR|nr:ABC transporter permease subunit [Thermogemmatispora aurantia]GER83986.1 spermidine/putrescine ABC transporter permease [Thermogemmatispora aurantia]
MRSLFRPRHRKPGQDVGQPSQHLANEGGLLPARLALALALLYLLIPLAATLVFGLSGSHGWGDLSSLGAVFGDPDFWQTLLTSLGLAAGTTVLVILLLTPTVYQVHLRLPQVQPLLEALALLPFAVPPIVLGTGLLQEYNGAATNSPLVDLLSLGLVPLLSNVFPLLDLPLLLICAYVIVALPFAYRAIDNSLRAVDVRVLTEAAASLGAGWWRTLLLVILPNIWPGILTAALLTFSTVMGELTLASLFNTYTFPIYLNMTGQNDPHRAALLAVLSFLLTLLCVLGMVPATRPRTGGGRAALPGQIEGAGPR